MGIDVSYTTSFGQIEILERSTFSGTGKSRDAANWHHLMISELLGSSFLNHYLFVAGAHLDTVGDAFLRVATETRTRRTS